MHFTGACPVLDFDAESIAARRMRRVVAAEEGLAASFGNVGVPRPGPSRFPTYPFIRSVIGIHLFAVANPFGAIYGTFHGDWIGGALDHRFSLGAGVEEPFSGCFEDLMGLY